MPIQPYRQNFTGRTVRGQALVPVIFVMLILTILAITFATSARREIRASGNFDSQTQRFFAAKGAVNYAMSALAQSSNNGATYGIVSPGPDTDANGWMQIGNAWVKIEVMDTAGLININSATAAALNRMPVFQQNPDLVAAITDWRTPGDQPSTNGAKSEYYNTLSPSYDCKSAPFDSVEELLLVKGITPTILYGTVTGTAVDSSTLSAQGASASTGPGSQTRQATGQRPGGSSPGTVTPGTGGTATPGAGGTGPPGVGGTGTGTSGTGTGTTATVGDTDWTDIYSNSTVPLSELLTTVAWERNVAADGTARVNINTATAADLTGIGLAQNLANGLVRFRTSGSGTQGGGGNGTGGGTGGGATPGGTGGTGGGGARPGGSNGGTGAGGGGVRPGGASLQSLTPGALPGFSPTRQGGNAGPGNGGNVRPGGGGNVGPGNGGNVGPGNGGNVRPGGGGNVGPGNGGNVRPGNGGGNVRPGGGGNGGPGGGGAGGGNAGGGGTGGGTTQTGSTFKSIADLLSVQGFTQTVMQQIADKISVDNKAYHDGMVNINTASQEVLATVPGMDHTTLQAILTYRQGGQAFQSLGDFFALTGLTRQQYQNVVSHLCTKSSFYRVRVKVRMPGRDTMYAVTALVQLTENGPQILQWKEAQRSPGWAYWTAPPTLPTPTPSSTGSSTSGSSSPSGTTGGG